MTAKNSLCCVKVIFKQNQVRSHISIFLLCVSIIANEGGLVTDFGDMIMVGQVFTDDVLSVNETWSLAECAGQCLNNEQCSYYSTVSKYGKLLNSIFILLFSLHDFVHDFGLVLFEY